METMRPLFFAVLCGILFTFNNGCWSHPWELAEPADDDTTLANDDDTTNSDDDDTVADDDDAGDDDTLPADDDDVADDDDAGDDDTVADDDDILPGDDDTTPEPDDYEGDEAGECDDEVDNDGDGLIDCDDPTCESMPACVEIGDDDIEEPTPPPAEICNGLDDDGDGQVDEGFDADADGWTTCEGDCNDANAAIHPSAPELCDGVNNDCDTQTDEDCPPPTVDTDGDGYTVAEGDCDDGDALIHPGATERCNGEDDDCSGALPSNELDADADGWMGCEGDCDDSDSATFQGATEICDGQDNNCNGQQMSVEIDNDGDGWIECTPVSGSPLHGGDCNDSVVAIHPSALELCNGVDDDCNGVVPSNEADADADGTRVCAGDCNDSIASVFPNAPELCDGINNDCDTQTDEGCSAPPPAWCPTGTVVELTTNGGFETAETLEYDPQPGNGWGYELNVSPVQTCSAPASAHGGSCFMTLLSNNSLAYYMEQLQFLVSPASVGLNTGDAIHVSVAARTVSGGDQTLALQILNDATYGSAVSFGSFPVLAPATGWHVSETTTSYTSSASTMRITVHFGGLAQNVRLDDFHVYGCL